MKQLFLSEFLGSLLLAAAVVGSGIMGAQLSPDNAAVALLANTLATVAILGVLIAMLAPLSGAHLNPVVTLVATLQRKLRPGTGLMYVGAQFLGCCTGAMLANIMFALPALQASAHARSGLAQWLAEIVATSGLILVAFTSPSGREAAWRVPAWIAGAYWFTASTSFANPAITVGRALTDTFSGIRPADVPGFAAAQIIGGFIGILLLRALAARKAGE